MGQSGLATSLAGPAGYVNTMEVGGSRFPLWDASAFNPAGQVGATTPTTLATLAVPPTFSSMGASPYGGSTSAASGAAAGSPWSPAASPLPWVIFALIFGLWAIHKLYFEKR
jgi:hypothetical protein